MVFSKHLQKKKRWNTSFLACWNLKCKSKGENNPFRTEAFDASFHYFQREFSESKQFILRIPINGDDARAKIRFSSCSLYTCLFAWDVFRRAATGQINIFHVKVAATGFEFHPSKKWLRQARRVFSIQKRLCNPTLRDMPPAPCTFFTVRRGGEMVHSLSPPQSFGRKICVLINSPGEKRCKM